MAEVQGDGAFHERCVQVKAHTFPGAYHPACCCLSSLKVCAPGLAKLIVENTEERFSLYCVCEAHYDYLAILGPYVTY